MNESAKKFLALVLLITSPLWLVPMGIYFILFGFYKMTKEIYSLCYVMVNAWFDHKK